MPRGAKWTPLRRAKVDHTLKRKRREKYEALYRFNLAEEQAAKVVLDALLAAATQAKPAPVTEVPAESA